MSNSNEHNYNTPSESSPEVHNHLARQIQDSSGLTITGGNHKTEYPSYKSVAPQLLRRGYEPIPIRGGSKTPEVKWNSDVDIDEKQVLECAERFPNAGVGIRTQRNILAIDLDYDNELVAKEFLRIVQDKYGLTPIRIRTGGSHKWLACFRCNEVMKKGVISYGKNQSVEFLTNTQFLAYGQHPDGDYYQWENGELFETPLKDLPVITHQDILELASEIDGIVGKDRASSSVEKMRDVNLNASAREQDGLPLHPANPDEVQAAGEFLLIKKGLASAPRDIWLKIIQGVQSTAWPDDDCPEWLINACRCDEYPNPERDVDYEWRYASGRRVDNPVTFGTVMHMANELGYQEHLSSKRYSTTVDLINACESASKLEQEIIPAIASDAVINELHRSKLTEVILTQYKSLGEPPPGKVKLKHAIALNKKTEAIAIKNIPDWASNWVYLKRYKLFYNLATGEELDKEAFNMENAAQTEVITQKTSASTLLSRDYRMQTFTDRVYEPGKDQTVTKNGWRYVNTYKPGTAMQSAVVGDGQVAIDAVLEHLCKLFSNDKERNHLIDYLAFRIQHPDIRINHALVIQGGVGIGKSTIGKIIRTIVGESNCTELSPTLMTGQFNDWQQGAMFRIVEEARFSGKDRFEVVNQLKPAITNDVLHVNAKFRAAWEIMNVTNYVMFTNYKDAIPFDADDRRYFVMSCDQQTPQQRLESFGGGSESECDEYFRKLHELIEAFPEALAYYFLNRDVSGFSAKGNAPKTAAKDEMYRQSRPEDEITLLDAIAEFNGIAICDDYIDLTLLTESAEEQYDFGLPRPERISRILKGRGMHSKRVKIEGQQHRIFSANSVTEEDVRERVAMHREAKRQIRKGNVVDFEDYRRAKQQLEAGVIDCFEEHSL